MKDRSGICCKNCFALNDSVSLLPLLSVADARELPGVSLIVVEASKSETE